jgi:hypothetical protein
MSAVVLTGILELAKKLIPDKDRFKELETEVTKAGIEFDRLLMGTTTAPWVDATVKLMYAFERFFTSLWRPLGTFALTAFAGYCDAKGIQLSETVEMLLYGAFPGWGVSRHMHKAEELKRKKPIPLPDIELR